MNASEFMSTDLISARADQTLEEAARIMAQDKISALPIVDEDNKLLGMVTECDFVGKKVDIPHALAPMKEIFGFSFHQKGIESIYKNVKKKSLDEVMTKNVKTIMPETSLTQVVELMLNKSLKRLPVIKENKLVGMITRKDLLKVFNQV